MDSWLRREVAEAVAAGTSLSTIEQTIIDAAPLDEEECAALWLLAEALIDLPHLRSGIRRPRPVLIGS